MSDTERDDAGALERDREADRQLRELLDLPEAERPARLASLPADVRATVERLLGDALADDGFLTPGGALREHLLAAALAEQDDPRGRRVGAYRILEEIGAGGMGRVFLGERADGLFERRVAIKILHLGAAPRDRGSLLRELGILAHLQHPAIAQLFDAGLTDDGDPYLVMELVDGEPIDAYARRLELGARGRLRLLIDLCTAVETAHRRLVVHRDIKPSNVLVDRTGAVKLLDFGIARILESELEAPSGDAVAAGTGDAAPRAAATATHRGSFLTPLYASPEQLRGDPVTTASDVFQLGLLGWELVSGRPVAEARTRPGDGDAPPAPPPRPSAGVALGPGLAADDLDAVIRRALAEAPEDRYPTADRLREDLENLLAGRPVRARPAGWRYRARRFAGRHRFAVAAALAGALAIAALSLGFTWRLAAERDAKQREAEAAVQARLGSEQTLAFLSDLFENADPLASLGAGRAPGELTARQMLDRSIERLGSAGITDPLVRARILTIVGGIYRRLGDATSAEPPLAEALRLREAAPGDHRIEIAEGRLALGNLRHLEGRYDEAIELFDRAIAEFRAAGDRRRLAPALTALGNSRLHRSDYEPAIAAFDEAIALWRDLGQGTREAQALIDEAPALVRLGRTDDARQRLARSLEILEAELPADHPLLALPMITLASLLSDSGRPGDAIPLLERAHGLLAGIFGPDHFRVAVVKNNLGVALTRSGDHQGALPHLLAALDGYRRSQPDHPDIGEILNNLGSVEWNLGRPREAERYYRQALEVLRRRYPEEHLVVAMAVYNLGEALFGQGRLDGAETELRHSQDLFAAKLGADHPILAAPLLYRARIAESRGDLETAAADFERALTLRRPAAQQDPAGYAEARDAWAGFLRRHGREAEAAAL